VTHTLAGYEPSGSREVESAAGDVAGAGLAVAHHEASGACAPAYPSRVCGAPCWCSHPPVRRVMSTGERYSLVQIASEGNVLVFAYQEGA